MKRMVFVHQMCRLLVRAIKDACVAAGVSFMMDPLFVDARHVILIALRNRTAFRDMLDVAMKFRVDRVYANAQRAQVSSVRGVM
jgi:hypothetical protein